MDKTNEFDSLDAFEQLVDDFEDPYHRGSCPNKTHTGTYVNSCGDIVHIELRIEQNIIKECWFTGTGCIISQASASKFCKYLEGVPATTDLFAVALNLEHVLQYRPSPRRIGCALAAWNAIIRATDELRNKPSSTGR